MRTAGVYVVEMLVKKCKYSAFPTGDTLITLRIGRNSTAVTHHEEICLNEVIFNTNLQLNVDNLALDTQRCSITLTSSSKRVIGMALITIPKDKDLIENTYKLTQSQDKRAEIDIRLRILPVQSTLPMKESQGKKVNNIIQDGSLRLEGGNGTYLYSGIVTKIDKPLVSSINLKSKASEDFKEEVDNKRSKSFKTREEDQSIQIKVSQLLRLKEEKEAYYQLYQIQKTKSEVANKFITLIIRRIQEHFPNMDLGIISQLSKRTNDLGQNRAQRSTSGNQVDQGRIDQLEQANRSLHRQVEEYKRLIEQLKGDLAKNGPKNKAPINEAIHASKGKNSLGIFDFQFKQKSNILPPELTAQEEKASSIADVDLKKWLQESVGQREKFQQILQSLAMRGSSPEKAIPNIQKLRMKIDRAFSNLLGKQALNRAAVLSHKQEVNRILDELI